MRPFVYVYGIFMVISTVEKLICVEQNDDR